MVSVVAPVYRDCGAVVAALSVSGPDSRLTPARAADVAFHCMTQADALSTVLGHRPTQAPNEQAQKEQAQKEQAQREQAQREGAG